MLGDIVSCAARGKAAGSGEPNLRARADVVVETRFSDANTPPITRCADFRSRRRYLGARDACLEEGFAGSGRLKTGLPR